jgi:hypothetical protein
MNRLLRSFFILALICILHNPSRGQSIIQGHMFDSVININKKQALDLLENQDHTLASPHWPNIKPSFFYANIRKNIISPTSINQGKSTNFCGYAALTHLLIKYNPKAYVSYMLELYTAGNVKLENKNISPTKEIKEAAGTLQNKGELDVLHADQLWFLTLADQFKGYMNIIDHKYGSGDENKIWAGTNYGKFNNMLAHFTKDKLVRRGSDFIRPSESDYLTYLNHQLAHGIVILFVNSKYLYPHKYSFFKLRAPTHFIVLYKIEKNEDMIDMQYWDYGMRTEQQITRKRLKQLIFGITTITRSNDALD